MTVSYTLSPVFWATVTHFRNLHLLFRRQLHALNLHLGFRQQLYTLATSTPAFDNSYTLWQPPPDRRFRRHAWATSTFVFGDNYTLWLPGLVFDGSYTPSRSLPSFSAGVTQIHHLHLRFRRQAPSAFGNEIRISPHI